MRGFFCLKLAHAGAAIILTNINLSYRRKSMDYSTSISFMQYIPIFLKKRRFVALANKSN